MNEKAPISRNDFEQLDVLRCAGNLLGARTLATTLLGEHHDLLSTCLIKGSMCLSEGQGQMAQAMFSQALAIAPTDPRCHFGMARSYVQLGFHQRAIASCQETLRLDPECWQACLTLADALAAIGHWDRAIERYSDVIAKGVNSALPHFGLGIALQQVGRLTESCEQFHSVIHLSPEAAAGYCNLGNTLLALGKCHEAGEMYRAALSLTPDTAIIYSNLANALLADRDFKGAEENSRCALELSPNLSVAHGNLAEALRGQERFLEAIPHYYFHGTPEASAKALECYYILGALDRFEEGLREQTKSGVNNIRAAAISTFAAWQLGSKQLSPFCAAPLDYVAIKNVRSKLEPFDKFAEEILREVAPLDSIWEPPSKSTKGGFQTEGNVFGLATSGITRLQRIIRGCITDYFNKHAASSDQYITRRPKELALTGWVVRLRQAGRQEAHIHPGGWLSGVCYLRLPPRSAPEEGAIEFTLSGYDYPAGSAIVPTIQHQPRVGDVVLFPSSLFHRTVPFCADSERISIAFDLLPPQ